MAEMETINVSPGAGVVGKASSRFEVGGAPLLAACLIKESNINFGPLSRKLLHLPFARELFL